eukprot:TRINITY_DN5867_c0_g1_i11.p1 TRINITY_DN5867_c0_g1~~TRINITY_DN5867_c0_g1_i11.p1  ORF type:complete len:319 (+),score=57.84 TRINITY_DN5867_c0_g1_i11:103-1059(+)
MCIRDSNVSRSFCAASRPKPCVITAKAWIVYDVRTASVLLAQKAKEKREIASLTKIMTAYTVLRVVCRLDIGILKARVTVSSEAFMMSGTSADLLVGDSLTVWDLLHGLLLPSGNDAAICLAEYFGFIINEIKLRPPSNPMNPINTFASEMNANARELKLLNTRFTNPHGLKDPLNKSTAEDIAKLTAACMQLPLFSEIVKKVSYTCAARNSSGKAKTYTWYNTNQLLSKGFDGAKTGNTVTAGSCLAASYKNSQHSLVIVVLGCKNESYKWREVIRLKDFIINKKKEEEPVKLPEIKKLTRGRSSVLTKHMPSLCYN